MGRAFAGDSGDNSSGPGGGQGPVNFAGRALAAAEVAAVLVQSVALVGRLMGPIIPTVVTVEQVQLLQSQVHL